VIGANAPLAVLSILLHLILLVSGTVLFFKKNKIGLFILSYLVAISAYNNLAVIYTGIVSERALFSPSLWFIAVVVCVVYSWLTAEKNTDKSNLRLVIMGLAAVCFSIYGVLTIERSTQWHDTIRLMSADIDHLENSTLANYFYGCVLKQKAEELSDINIQDKYLAESKKYLYKTCTLSPTYPYGYFRLGLIYRYDRYTPDSAYYFFKKAYSLNPEPPDIDYQFGRAEYEFGDMKLSNDVFANLYQRIPGDTFTVFYHALLQMKTGHLQEGHQINAIFLNMTPTYYQGYFNEGLYYQLTGDSASAAQNYETSLKYGCLDQSVYRFLIDYYQKTGRRDDVNRLLPLLAQ
jgi:hypothetical protein